MKILPFLIFPFPLLALTILLDPGHGGDENGAQGQYQTSSGTKDVFEKDFTLTIALQIKNFLSKDHRVFLTRSVDRNVTLEERAQMAEIVKPDLFISIHANSSVKKSAHGHEIYYLDNHQDAAVKKLEQIENKSFSTENSIVQQILIDLVIAKTVESSKILANKIQANLKKELKTFSIKDRGIKPGLFYVLALTKRPAVLLEVGFMSHASELKKLDSPSFQSSYSQAVSEGISAYIKSKN